MFYGHFNFGKEEYEIKISSFLPPRVLYFSDIFFSQASYWNSINATNFLTFLKILVADFLKSLSAAISTLLSSFFIFVLLNYSFLWLVVFCVFSSLPMEGLPQMPSYPGLSISFLSVKYQMFYLKCVWILSEIYPCVCLWKFFLWSYFFSPQNDLPICC